MENAAAISSRLSREDDEKALGHRRQAKWRTSRRLGAGVSSSIGEDVLLAVLALTAQISMPGRLASAQACRHPRSAQAWFWSHRSPHKSPGFNVFLWTSAASATLSLALVGTLEAQCFRGPASGRVGPPVFDGRSEPLRPGSSNCRARNSKRWSPIRERPGRSSRAPLRARRPGPTGEREPPMSRAGPRRRDASGYGVVPGFRGLEGGRDGGDEAAEITAANRPGPPRPPARRREPVPVNRNPNCAGRPIAEVVGGPVVGMWSPGVRVPLVPDRAVA
jgi:hypothetical protein